MKLIFYYITLICIYVAKIETVLIDKKKGIIKYTLLNCFLSKEEYVKQIDELNKIEMVYTGVYRTVSDSRYYIMRLTFNDNTIIKFGKTFSFYEIQKKYRICLALLNGKINLQMSKIHELTDETIEDIE